MVPAVKNHLLFFITSLQIRSYPEIDDVMQVTTCRTVNSEYAIVQAYRLIVPYPFSTNAALHMYG